MTHIFLVVLVLNRNGIERLQLGTLMGRVGQRGGMKVGRTREAESEGDRKRRSRGESKIQPWIKVYGYNTTHSPQ